MSGGEGTRRPSHYTHGRGIVCVPCAEEALEDGIAVEMFQARYFAGRAMLCGHCHAKIGPWTGGEIEPGELRGAMELYHATDTLPGRDEDRLPLEELLLLVLGE